MIHTYGGGEILRHVFDSIAILTKGNLFKCLMIIGASFGCFWTLAKCLFSHQIESFLLQFLFPVLAVSILLCLPKATVKIADVYVEKPYAVDNVPWLIAFPAQWISTIGYLLTEGIENALVVPNDTRYNKTGMIFGSETALDIRNYRLSNASLEQNLERFSKQCVFYDLALNKYSLNEFKKTTDLWKFLEENTSKVRMIPFTDPKDLKKGTVYLSCVKAVEAMKPFFTEEKDYMAKQEIGKHLPFTFQALTKLTKDQGDLISQQLMMNFFKGELGQTEMAKQRVQAQQKIASQSVGEMGSYLLVIIRAILEALLYLSVIFVLPLLVSPTGFSLIWNWLQMLIWIQLWPPMYAVVNYLMQIIAQSLSQKVFSGLSESELGLSFFTNEGLFNLYNYMSTLSSYLGLLVPLLSYALLKGGVASFMQLTNSLTQPIQSMTASVAAEAASGNYSFANATMGQQSYGNASTLQQNYAPSLSTGFMTMQQGNLSETFTPQETLLRHGSSELRWGISSDSAITESFQKAQASSDSFTSSQQQNYMESVSTQSRWLSDLTSHLSDGKNYNESFSERQAADLQESARSVQSHVSNLSQQYGISEQESLSLVLGGNIPIIGGANYSSQSANQEATQEAFSIANNADFQKNLQTVTDFAQSSAYTKLNDEGQRLSQGTAQSVDETKQAQQHYQAALTHSDQLSETSSWASQNTQYIRKALNQDLVNWASEEKGYEEAKRVITAGSDQERSQLVSEFVQDLYGQSSFNYTKDPSQLYQSAKVSTIDKQDSIAQLQSHSFKQIQQHFNREEMIEKGENLQTKVLNSSEAISQDVDRTARYLNDPSHGSESRARLKTESSGSMIQDRMTRPLTLGLRLAKAPTNQVQTSQAYHAQNLPLGWQGKKGR